MSFYWQHLIEGFFPGDKSRLYQLTTRPVQRGLLHAEALCQHGVGIIAEALGVGHRDQKQIKGRRRMAQAVNPAVTNQTVIHPAELFGDPSDPVGKYGVFLYHAHLL